MSTPSPLSSSDVLQREREEAYELLGQIVRENHAAGRRSYGASVKPELRRRTFDGFDEGRLRFDSFSHFLREAEGAGAVTLQKAPRGPDLMLAPPGEMPIAEPPKPDERRRVRRDLWDCFIDWDERYTRAYDIEVDVAERFPATPAPLEPPDKAELRRTVAENPERFRTIEPIPFTTQLDWMREFAAAVEDPLAHAELTSAFVSARPARVFAQALSGHPAVRSRWNASRQAKVETEIRRWVEQSDLDIEIYGERAAEPEATTSGDRDAAATAPDERPPNVENDRLIRMRDELKRIIDRMPASELERLNIPYGYTFDA